MPLILEVPPEVEAQLRAAAAREGSEVADYVLAAATEKLLTLEAVDDLNESYCGHAADLIQLGLLDFRTVRGQRLVSDRDLARYQKELRENPDKAMDELTGMSQLRGDYDQ